MKTKFIIIIILILNILSIKNIVAQEYKMNCQMTVTEILEQQNIEKDTREYMKARTITEVLLSEINLFYYELNNTGVGEATDKHKDAVLSTIKSAKIIGMNYSMFMSDLDIVSSTPRFEKKQEKCKTQNN